MNKEIILYETPDGTVKVEVKFEGETFWLTQKAMAELFGCTPDNISLHLKNIFNTNELDQKSVTEKSSATASDGKNYPTNFYNLDVVKVIQFSNKRLLEGSGAMSHEAMKTIVGKEYDTFDADRKKIDAAQADREEQEAIQKLLAHSKKK